MKKLLLALAVSAGAMAAVPANAATTIVSAGQATDTYCLSTHSSCNQSIGQTFRLAAGETSLTQATMNIRIQWGSAVNYAFQIYGWNGSNQTGAALYDSGKRTLTSATYTTATFDTNLLLTSGQQYIGLFTIIGQTNDAASAITVAGTSRNTSTYANGALGRRNHGGVWQFPLDIDAAFSFAFDTPAVAAAVPEPGTWGLMLAGFGLMGSALRARRRKDRFSVA